MRRTTESQDCLNDLKVRPETIKLLGENIVRTPFDVYHSNILLDLLPKAKKAKAKTKIWNLLKPESFSQQGKPLTK